MRPDLLRVNRENHNMLRETRNGCALWNNKDWLETLVMSSISK